MSQSLIDDEAVRLLAAFVQVKDPEARRLIIALVEAASRGGKIKTYRVDDKIEPKPH